MLYTKHNLSEIKIFRSKKNMDMLDFKEIYPFVRYSHLLDKNIQECSEDVCAYDHRLFYCYNGKGNVTINQNTYQAKTGTLFLWNSAIPYRYAPDPHDPMQLLAVNFDYTHVNADLVIPIPPDHIDSYNTNNQLEHFIFRDIERFNHPLILHNQNYLYDKLLELNEEYQSKKILYQQRCSGLLLTILSHLAIAESTPTPKNLELIDNIIAYLNEHYSEPITLKRLGDLFGYHPNYLNQLFVKYTEKTLYHYLLDLRIMHAITLIQNTDLSISAIATSVGFHDFPHFSRYFKEKTGHSPSDFRL